MNKLELLYISLAVVLWFTGYFLNGKFVRPKWKIPGKFIFYTTLSFFLTHWINHYSLIFIIGHPLIGMLFHIKACKEHDINWLTCQPRNKYIELQEKWAKGDFGSKIKDKH